MTVAIRPGNRNGRNSGTFSRYSDIKDVEIKMLTVRMWNVMTLSALR